MHASTSKFFVTTALTLALAALSGTASASSSASSAASDSVGSSSTSVEKSSDSSSGNKNVAQGQYEVVNIAAVDARDDMMRVELRGTSAGATQNVVLLLPVAVAERGALVKGAVIEAQARPYGLAFATVAALAPVAADQKAPFFLLLDDAWHRELDSRPVVL